MLNIQSIMIKTNRSHFGFKENVGVVCVISLVSFTFLQNDSPKTTPSFRLNTLVHLVIFVIVLPPSRRPSIFPSAVIFYFLCITSLKAFFRRCWVLFFKAFFFFSISDFIWILLQVWSCTFCSFTCCNNKKKTGHRNPRHHYMVFIHLILSFLISFFFSVHCSGCEDSILIFV